MRLVWSPVSLRDRDAIYDFISLYNPKAAIRVDQVIEGKAESLVDYPLRGRCGRLDITRELIVSGTPYIIVYIIESDVIRILRVLHSAQDWPEASR